jgi:hypothetical protein
MCRQQQHARIVPLPAYGSLLLLGGAGRGVGAGRRDRRPWRTDHALQPVPTGGGIAAAHAPLRSCSTPAGYFSQVQCHPSHAHARRMSRPPLPALPPRPAPLHPATLSIQVHTDSELPAVILPSAHAPTPHPPPASRQARSSMVVLSAFRIHWSVNVLKPGSACLPVSMTFLDSIRPVPASAKLSKSMCWLGTGQMIQNKFNAGAHPRRTQRRTG